MADVFFDAAVGEESWPRALNQLSQTFGGFESHFMVWDRVHSQVDFSAWADFADREAESYSRCEALIRSRHGEVILTQKLPAKTFLYDPIYVDFLRPLGTRYIMGLKLAESESKLAMLRIHRRAKSGPYTDLDARRLGLSFPGFSRAAQFYVDQRQLKQAAAVAAACFDQLKIGMIVIDRNLRILHADGIARQALDQSASLEVRDGFLVLHPDDADATLLRAVDQIASRACPPTAGHASPRLTAGDYELTVSPLTERDSVLLCQSRSEAFLITVKRTERLPASVCPKLKRIFGLTHSEAAIAEKIVRGQTLRQIADENSITINTVKTHVKAVFAKVGVVSQSDLIRTVLTGNHGSASTVERPE